MNELRVYLKTFDFLINSKKKPSNFQTFLLLYKDLFSQGKSPDLYPDFLQILIFYSSFYLDDRTFINEVWFLLEILLISYENPLLYLDFLTILIKKLEIDDEKPRIDVFSFGTPGISILFKNLAHFLDFPMKKCIVLIMKTLSLVILRSSEWENPLIYMKSNEEIAVFFKKFGYKTLGKLSNYIRKENNL